MTHILAVRTLITGSLTFACRTPSANVEIKARRQDSAIRRLKTQLESAKWILEVKATAGDAQLGGENLITGSWTFGMQDFNAVGAVPAYFTIQTDSWAQCDPHRAR